MQSLNNIKNGFLESVDKNKKRNIIACLKAGKSAWQEYINTPSKTGQLASKYLKRFKTIDSRFQGQLDEVLLKDNVSLEQMKQVKGIFYDAINQLERKAKKYMEHEAEMQIINMKSSSAVEVEETQEDQIKQEMLELVEKFKKYAVQIQGDLQKDADVIGQINTKQDKQLSSLKTKSQSLKQIIKNQKLGFFQLIAMGIIAIALWIFGLFIIMII